MIGQCLATSDCAITTDELDLYTNYKSAQEGKVGEKLKESKVGKAINEEQKEKK